MDKSREVMPNRTEDIASSEHITHPACVELRKEAEEIRRRELQKALSVLESEGTLTDSQRDIIRNMTITLVANLLTPFETTLEEASKRELETDQVIMDLFDINLKQDNHRGRRVSVSCDSHESPQ